MSGVWHWFVILGTLGSLGFFLALLIGNRKTGGDNKTGHDFDGIEEYDNPLPMWWVWMFALSILFALAYLLWYPGLGGFAGLAGWSSAAAVREAEVNHKQRFAPLYEQLAALDETQLTSSRQALQVGRRLFINHCSTCHGVNARGAPGFPDLSDSEWLWGAGVEQVTTSIDRGREAVMPAWQAALGDQGVADVTQYLMSLSGRAHEAAAAARGAERYRAFCVACHGADGQGNPALGAPDLSNDVWLYGGTAEQIALSIREGRNGQMPAFDSVLGDAKIRLLSGYVRSLGRE